MFYRTAFVVIVTALLTALQSVPAIASGTAVASSTGASSTPSSPIPANSRSTVAPGAVSSPSTGRGMPGQYTSLPGIGDAPRVPGSIPQQQTCRQLKGGVNEIRVLVDTAVRQIKQTNDKLAKDSLIMANEANRHVAPAPMAPNAFGNVVLPPITLNNASLGRLPPRPRVLRSVLGDINAEVRALQHDERAINATVCRLGDDQATMWWNRIVSTTSDIIDTYRVLEPAALSPKPQVRSLAMPTIHLYEDTKKLDSLWKNFNQALGSYSEK